MCHHWYNQSANTCCSGYMLGQSVPDVLYSCTCASLNTCDADHVMRELAWLCLPCGSNSSLDIRHQGAALDIRAAGCLTALAVANKFKASIHNLIKSFVLLSSMPGLALSPRLQVHGLHACMFMGYVSRACGIEKSCTSFGCRSFCMLRSDHANVTVQELQSRNAKC